MPHGDQGKTTLRGGGSRSFGRPEGGRQTGSLSAAQERLGSGSLRGFPSSLSPDYRLQLQRRERRQGTWPQPSPPSLLLLLFLEGGKTSECSARRPPQPPRPSPTEPAPQGPCWAAWLCNRSQGCSPSFAAAPADLLLTGSKQDDLVVQWELREMGDPLGPLHQCEELLVCRLADVGDRVIGLPREETPPRGASEGLPFSPSPAGPLLRPKAPFSLSCPACTEGGSWQSLLPLEYKWGDLETWILPFS